MKIYVTTWAGNYNVKEIHSLTFHWMKYMTSVSSSSTRTFVSMECHFPPSPPMPLIQINWQDHQTHPYISKQLAYNCDNKLHLTEHNIPLLNDDQWLTFDTIFMSTSVSVTARCDETLDQSKYLRVKQSHGFPLWASSGFRNWQNAWLGLELDGLVSGIQWARFVAT